MQRGLARQNRWFELEEEDHRAKKNLSRLIHTVQNIPSSRSRLDTNSLWNLCGELESFNPAATSASLQFGKKSDRKKKGFSKKYLNLRLHPSNDPATNLSREPCDKTQCEVKTKAGVALNDKLKPSREINRTGTNLKATDSVLINNTQQKRSSIRENNAEGNSLRERNDNAYSKGINKSIKTQMLHKKEEVKQQKQKQQVKVGVASSDIQNTKIKLDSKNKSYRTMSIKKEVENSESTINSKFRKANHENYQKLDRVKERKTTVYRDNKCHKAKLIPEETVQTIIYKNNLTAEQSSMVKTLTNYWNNFLKNDLESYNSVSRTSVVEFPRAKSLEDAKGECYSRNKLLSKHKDAVKLHHMSNINITNRLELSSSSSSVLTQSSSSVYNSSSQIHMTSTLSSIHLVRNVPRKRRKSSRKLSISEESSMDASSSEVLDSIPTSHMFPENIVQDTNTTNGLNLRGDVPVTFSSVGVFDEICCSPVGDRILNKEQKYSPLNVMPDSETSTEDAVEIMQQLIFKLKSYPESPILSDKIPLPVAIKTMLCLMTVTLSSSKDDLFSRKIDFQVPHLLPKDNQCKSEHRFKNSYSSPLSPIQSKESMISDASWYSSDYSLESLLENKANIKEISIKSSKVRDSTVKSVVAVQGITLGKVMDALTYLMLCKELLWMKFLLGGSCGPNDKFHPEMFTFIYEGGIVIERDSYSEEDSDEEDYSSDEEDLTTLEILRSALSHFSNSVKNCINLVFFYLPDSIESVIGTVYQFLVSVFIWRVIVREMFSK